MEPPQTAIAKLRAHALRIVRAGIDAADPRDAVRRALMLEEGVLFTGDGASHRLSQDSRVLLLGVGKAVAAMVLAALERLGPRVAAGVVTMPRQTSTRADTVLPLPDRLSVWEGGHPIPDIGGMAAAAETLAVGRSAEEQDLVICLLSGGASAMWAAPAPGLTLDDLRRTNTLLLRCGAPIEAVNSVRKHLSAIAGGRLAQTIAPARVLTLAVSDVIGTGADAIGSGPTLPDPTSFGDALEVVRSYAVDLPPAVLHHLRTGYVGGTEETPKPGDLSNLAGFHVVLSVEDALNGAAAAARRLGYRGVPVTTALRGEARNIGERIAAEAIRAAAETDDPVALLWGGETTVTVRGEGRGGRNQELALAAAIRLQARDGVVLASAGTDGRDGPTDASGGIVDGGTVARGARAGLDASTHLANNDSYSYLRASGDLIITGPTGTNVNDLAVALIHPAAAAESA